VLVTQITDLASRVTLSFNATSDINGVLPLNVSCPLVTTTLGSQSRLLQSSSTGLQFDFDISLPADASLSARYALLQQYLTVLGLFFSGSSQSAAALIQLLQDSVLALVSSVYGSTSGYSLSSSITSNGSPYSYNVPSSATSSSTTNAIIGGVVGGVGGLIVIALVTYFVLRSQRKSKVMTSDPAEKVEEKDAQDSVVLNPAAAKSKKEFVPESI
jgi:hypothetical protein